MTPENKRRLFWEILVGGIIVLSVLLLYATGKAEQIASRFTTESSIVASEINKDKSTNTETKMQNHIVLETNKGNIEIELFADKAPNTVANFMKLAGERFYDGTRFHRIIKDFMIQGGDPLSRDATAQSRWGTGGPGYQFADEINDVKIVKGILAMANAGPNTNGSQFFIVTAEATPWLDGKHTAFGRVISGMDIVLKIENMRTGQADRPVEDVVILRATVK